MKNSQADDMNSEQREEWLARLIDLEFDCDENPEELARALEESAELRALQIQARSAASVLRDAASDETAEFRAEAAGHELMLPSIAKHRSRFWPRISMAAAALFCLAISINFVRWRVAESSLHGFQEREFALSIQGPKRVRVGTEIQVDLGSNDLRGSNPLPSQAVWSARDTLGRVIADGQVDLSGSAPLALSVPLANLREVEVAAKRGDVRRWAEFKFDHTLPALVHLATDKPVHRPGDEIRTRIVALDPLNQKPTAPRMLLRLVDPSGVVAGTTYPHFGNGAAAATWTLPEEAKGGLWKLEARDPQGDFTVQTLDLPVRAYRAPRLVKTVVLDRETYAPGQRGGASVVVERVEGGAAAMADVEARLVIDDEPVWEERAALDAQGRAEFTFDLPHDIQRGAGQFIAIITDGGTVETRVEPFVVPTGRLQVTFCPEGGDLVAGVQNRVYAEVRDSLDRPISARGNIMNERGEVVALFDTEHLGRARFEFTPRAEGRYRLSFSEPQAPAVDLPRAKSGAVALRTLDDRTPAGEPLRLQVSSPTERNLICAVFLRGQLVGSQASPGPGIRELGIELPEEVSGVLRLTVFDEDLTPLAERLVARGAAQKISVELLSSKESLIPGERQSVRVRTTAEDGQPIAALVGVTVHDGALDDLASEPPIGLLDRALFHGEVQEIEDIAGFASTDPNSRLHIDLALGTRGWRRFLWAANEEAASALVEKHRDEGQLAQLYEGVGATQVTATDDGEMMTRSYALSRSVWKTRRQLNMTLVVTIWIMLGLLLALLPAWAVARFLGKPLRPAPMLAFAVPILIGLPLLLPQTLRLGADGAEITASVRQAPGASIESEEELQLDDFFDSKWEAAPAESVEAADSELESPPEEAAEPALSPVVLDPASESRQASIRRGDAVAIRVFAHVHQPSTAERVDFQDVLYWNTHLATGVDGEATVEFDTSDSITTWVVRADAHATSGERVGRVGQASAEFNALLPFDLEPKLPTAEFAAGDRISMPVAVVCREAGVTSARVRLQLGGPLAFVDGAALDQEQEIALVDGRGRAVFQIDVFEGRSATLALSGEAAGHVDRVRREVHIRSNGFPIRRSYAGMLTGDHEFEISLPEGELPRALISQLELHPSPLSDLVGGIEGLLQEPHGCFEQTSATHYPNVLALGLLEGGSDEPAFAARARELVATGYDRLVSFECSDDGYEWFGANPAHEALTAFGLLEFHDMQTRAGFAVDPKMMDRTRNWLLERRDGDGGYLRENSGFHGFGNAPAPIIDAYITYALSLSGQAPESLQVELDRLSRRAVESNDPYEVALAAGALHAAGRHEAAQAGRIRLRDMQTASTGALDNPTCEPTTSITHSGGTNLVLETTALAILAWLDGGTEDDLAHVERGLRYLRSSRSPHGAFGSTQSTVQCLRALTAYAERVRRAPFEGSLELWINDVPVREFFVEASTNEPLSFEGLEDHLRPGTNRIRLAATATNGTPNLPWAFGMAYRSDEPADDPNATVAIETGLLASSVREGETATIEATIRNLTRTPVPMTIASIGLPAGLEILPETLDAALAAGDFAYWETNGRELHLYWRGLDAQEARRVSLTLSARLPGTTTGPASRVRLYYTPEQERWANPLEIEIE